jgi:hypothetical protein
MSAVGTESLQNVRNVYRNSWKCALWVQETTTMTTTKSLQNSSRETLSEYLVIGIIIDITVVAPIMASYNFIKNKPYVYQKLSLLLLLRILGAIDD